MMSSRFTGLFSVPVRFFFALSVLLLTLSAPVPFSAQVSAQENAEETRRRRASQTVDPATGRVLQVAYEFLQAEDYSSALSELKTLLSRRGSSMKPFDLATTYEMLGTVNVALENYRVALSDFRKALEQNVLPPARESQMRYFSAQLLFQLEDYRGAIAGLNRWIVASEKAGQTVDANAYYLLAAAYTQLPQPDYRSALRPVEKSLSLLSAPRKSYYDLANLVYSETGNIDRRLDLLENMITYWPDTKTYWTQLSAMYAEKDRTRDAFSAIELAYRAGLLDRENELIGLVRYYSAFENYYRAASLLEREMEAGNIDDDEENLILLSQLWTQARERTRSIPVLRRAAKISSSGDQYFMLGQVLLADEKYADAQAALEMALKKGRMDDQHTGEASLLLGTAIFNQSGSEDTVLWAKAREAFTAAGKFSNTRGQARSWIAYIDAVFKAFKDSLVFNYAQNVAVCKEDIIRIERIRRIRDLRNREVPQEELVSEQGRIDECNALIEQGPPAGDI